jgi:hypothetical protein
MTRKIDLAQTALDRITRITTVLACQVCNDRTLSRDWLFDMT